MSPRKIEIGKRDSDDVPDRVLVDVRRPEIEVQHLPQPLDVADVHRLVEAVVARICVDRSPGERRRPARRAAPAAARAIAIWYCMICRSTGPPGTNCMMTKTATVMPEERRDDQQ